MKKSRFMNSADGGDDEPSGPVFDRYGMSEKAWLALTPEQRVTHYNRLVECEHKADIESWPVELRESYSFDPYFHVAHSTVHTAKGFFDATCECQSCVNDIGIERGSPFEYKKRRRNNGLDVTPPTPQGAENERMQKPYRSMGRLCDFAKSLCG